MYNFLFNPDKMGNNAANTNFGRLQLKKCIFSLYMKYSLLGIMYQSQACKEPVEFHTFIFFLFSNYENYANNFNEIDNLGTACLK